MYTLVAGGIGGAASALLSALAMPDAFGFSGVLLQHFYKALVIGALIPIATFLKQSPLPNGSYVASITTSSTTIRKSTPSASGEEPHIPTGE